MNLFSPFKNVFLKYTLKYALILFLTLLVSSTFARADVDFERWLDRQKMISVERMMKNISPPGTKPGTVVASPSRNNPDYYFHWVRDASLTMNAVIGLAEQTAGAEQAIYLNSIADFVSLSVDEQQRADLGEPRFNVDGAVDTIPWSRPQNDGPALRVLVLIRFLKSFPVSKLSAEIFEIIRRDLDFIEKKWTFPCYDIWEELKGLHFYTLNLQYAALKSGGAFLKTDHFIQSALAMEPVLNGFWDSKMGYIGASQNLELESRSPTYKQSNLDTAVILGVLHTGLENSFFALNDDKVFLTATALEKLFRTIYKVNGPAIGRFEDDVYFGGNPWYMTTAAFAEYYYLLAARSKSGEKQGLIHKGDSFLKTIHQFIGSQGEMSEQFDREAGVPVSARDLTWSYAGFLTALEARAKVIRQ